MIDRDLNDKFFHQIRIAAVEAIKGSSVGHRKCRMVVFSFWNYPERPLVIEMKYAAAGDFNTHVASKNAAKPFSFAFGRPFPGPRSIKKMNVHSLHNPLKFA